LDTGKENTLTIKIKCLEQTARNFATFSDKNTTEKNKRTKE
jgi:hypothetical protein